MLSGVNSFEINEIQDEETGATLTRRLECNNATLALKTAGWNNCVPQGIWGADMALKEEVEEAVGEIIREGWTNRDGRVVPVPDDLGLGNDAVNLNATVLYADMADSTDLVDNYKPKFAAEIYKAYLVSTAKIVKDHGGSITAYDGDRIMGVFIGDYKNGSAREFAETRILGCFLKDDEFGLGDRHALSLEQQVAEILVTAAPSKKSFDVAVDSFHHSEAYFRATVAQDSVQVIQQHEREILKRYQPLPAQLIDPTLQIAQHGSFIAVGPQPLQTFL
jgi:hypothetical protein